MIDYPAKIEALLFYRTGGVTKQELQKILALSEDQLRDAVQTLKERLNGHGITLLETEALLELTTVPEAHTLIEHYVTQEREKDITKASRETLAIILYKRGASRSDIEYIRGVNSSFILRNLLLRGLIEREPSPTDHRKFIYKPTADTLAFLGISSINALPNQSEIEEKIKMIIAAAEHGDEE